MRFVSSLLTIFGLAASSAVQAQDSMKKEYEGELQVICVKAGDTVRADVIEFYDNTNITVDNGRGIAMTSDWLVVYPSSRALTFASQVHVMRDGAGELSAWSPENDILRWGDDEDPKQKTSREAVEFFVVAADKLCRDNPQAGDKAYSRHITVASPQPLGEAAVQIKNILGY